MKNTTTTFGTSPISQAKRAIFTVLFCFAAFMLQASGLPVININTQNAAEINSRDVWTNMTHFSLTDPNNSEFNVERENITPRLDRIRGRGNSTWWAPKRPYRIRFSENVSFFGLPAAENWVLLAGWHDATVGIKNAFAFELGARLGVPHTPSFNFVELYLNGEFQGTYILTEHRQAAPAGVEPGPGRVDIHPESGWLIEFDFRWLEEHEDPKFRTTHYNLPIVIKASNPSTTWDGFEECERNGYCYSNIIPDGVDNGVRNDWNQLANLMVSSSFPENGYRDLIDMQSIVNFFLVQVIMNNHDFNHPGSVFWHKAPNGLITAGPLWDFDLSAGAFHRGMGGTLHDMVWTNWFPEATEFAPDASELPRYWFFARFFDDPVFKAMWIESWNSNRDVIFSMVDFIADTADKIRESANRNYSIWRVEEQVDFDWWVNDLKNYINVRLAFLDSLFNDGTDIIDIPVSDLIVVYPNPFTDEVRILVANAEQSNTSLQIVNILGTVVHTQNISSSTEIIYLGHLPAGVYFFLIEKDGKTKTVRMIKN